MIKVEKMGTDPLIVRSDGHYSMGAECSQLALKGNRLRISLRAPAMEEIHYGVLLPEEAGDGIREVSVTIPKGEAGSETEI